MAIFKLTQIKQSTGADTGNAAPTESTVVKEQEQPAGQAQPTEQEAFSLTATVDKEDPKYLIQVDGAAGHMFTEALNRVLAVENMSATSIPVYVEHQDKELKRLYPKHKMIHVHVVNGEELSVEDVVAVQNDVLKNGDGSEYVVAAESFNFSKTSVMSRYTSLRNLEKVGHMRVSNSFQQAAEYIRDMVLR